MTRAERRRVAAIERKTKQRWARGVRQFHEQALGAFAVEIVRPMHLLTTRTDLAVPLLLGWYVQAREHPLGVLCMLCDADLTPPTAPGAWLIVSGAVGGAGEGLITGICKNCAAHADDDLLGKGIDYLRQLWPDLREGSAAALHREGGRA
jgi:hypothetical protein